MIKKIKTIFLLFLFLGIAEGQSDDKKISPAQEKFVEVDGAELFCRVVGKGKPIIVLHGGPGLGQEYLLPQMDRLAEDHLVIFYDQRGSGRSTGEVSEKTMSLDVFIADLESIRKAFQLDKITLLGHSWGGFLAMKYAIIHPEFMDSLVLTNSVPASSDELALFFQEWALRLDPYKEQIAKIQSSKAFIEGDPDALASLHILYFRKYCFMPEKAELINLKSTVKASINGEKIRGIIAQNIFRKSYDLHEALKKLKIRTLILHGDADIVPYATAKSIHESIQGSKYILMKNCGHFPYVEDPDSFFEYVKSFLHEKE